MTPISAPRAKLLVPSSATGGACSVYAVRGMSSAFIPPHRRERHDALVVVLSGRVRIRCGADTARVVMPSSAVWLPRDQPCRVDFIEESLLSCAILPGGLEQLTGLIGKNHAAAPDPDDLAALLTLDGVTAVPVGWGGRGTEPALENSTQGRSQLSPLGLEL